MFHRKKIIYQIIFILFYFFFFCFDVMTRPGDYRMQQVCRATRRRWLILCVVREKKETTFALRVERKRKNEKINGRQKGTQNRTHDG
jgi:hypothetical protein